MGWLMQNYRNYRRRELNVAGVVWCGFLEVGGYSQMIRKTSTEGFTFISPCCFGHLIKKGHKIVDSQLQSHYKKKHCIDVSLSIYTHTVHDTKDVNIQVEAGMTLGCKNDGGKVTSSPIPSGCVRSCSGPILDEDRQVFLNLLRCGTGEPVRSQRGAGEMDAPTVILEGGTQRQEEEQIQGV